MTPALTNQIRVVVDVAFAYLLALPVAWERERYDRTAGLRTFPLVCVASCALVSVVGDFGSAEQSRVIQGLIGGIGFIGGGTILKDGLTVRGTATAASILVTAVIGVAVAHHLYLLATALSVLSFGTLRVFEHRWRQET